MGCSIDNCKQVPLYEHTDWDGNKFELCDFHLSKFINCAGCGFIVASHLSDSDELCPSCQTVFQEVRE